MGALLRRKTARERELAGIADAYRRAEADLTRCEKELANISPAAGGEDRPLAGARSVRRPQYQGARPANRLGAV